MYYLSSYHFYGIWWPLFLKLPQFIMLFCILITCILSKALNWSDLEIRFYMHTLISISQELKSMHFDDKSLFKEIIRT